MWTGIEVLYPLQEFRLQNLFLEDVFVAMSSKVFYLVLPLMIIAAFYWFIDKRQGEIVGVSCVTSMLMAAVVKYGFDQPRPWDLSDRILKVESANAVGPSLPSGHTATAVSSYIPAAMFMKRHILSAVLLAITVLVISSRLILCVHTPLDIIAGVAIAVAILAVTWYSIDWCYGDDRRYMVVNFAYIAVVSVLALISIHVWNGDSLYILGYVAYFYGMMAGRILDRIYVRYEVPELDIRDRIVRYIAGMAAAGVLLAVPLAISLDAGRVVGAFLVMLWIFLIYPRIMMSFPTSGR